MPMDILADETTFYSVILLSMWSVVFGYIIASWYRNRDKYLVRIKYPTEKKLLVRPDGTKVTLAKGKGRYAPAWTVDFDLSCLYFSKSLFSKRLTLDVMPDASKAISYHGDIKPDDIPKWTRKEHDEYANLSGLRALQALSEQKTSIVMWIIVVLLIIDIIIPFLTSGRIRF